MEQENLKGKNVRVWSDNLRVLLSLFGVIKENPTLGITGQTNNPELQFLNTYFPKLSNCVDLEFPSTPEDLDQLDEFNAFKQNIEFTEIYGMVVEEAFPKIVLSWDKLMSPFFLFRCGKVIGKSYPLYPAPNTTTDVNGILITNKEHIPMAKCFAEGLGIPQSTIVNLEEYSLQDRISMCTKSMVNSSTPLVADADSPELWAIRSRYIDYKQLPELSPILAVYPEDETRVLNTRDVLSWNQVFPVSENLSSQGIASVGQVWKLRSSVNFDIREFFKRYANGDTRIFRTPD